MTEDIELNLNRSLDFILDQLNIGNTVDNLKKGLIRRGFQQVKEWKSKFGFQFHIYSNDHFIDNKPHFHLVKKSENIDCRIFFDGKIYDCGGSNHIDKRTIEALNYFLSLDKNQKTLTSLWNLKNPQLLITT